jgi:hypothetical protein
MLAQNKRDRKARGQGIMPRSRMVKPEFWDDEKLATISRDARLTFVGMWTHSDDYGVVKGHPAWLKNKIYPYEEIRQLDFQKWLNELEKLVCILPFDSEGEKYYYIRAFTKHQVINRPSAQRNPEPPQNIIDDSLNTHGILIDETETEVKPKPKPKLGEKAKPQRNVIPPEKEWVEKYCSERKNGIDAQAFIDHYTNTKWKIGKPPGYPMTDWEASVRTWERNNKDKPSKPIDTEDYIGQALDRIKGVS